MKIEMVMEAIVQIERSVNDISLKVNSLSPDKLIPDGDSLISQKKRQVEALIEEIINLIKKFKELQIFKTYAEKLRNDLEYFFNNIEINILLNELELDAALRNLEKLVHDQLLKFIQHEIDILIKKLLAEKKALELIQESHRTFIEFIRSEFNDIIQNLLNKSEFNNGGYQEFYVDSQLIRIDNEALINVFHNVHDQYIDRAKEEKESDLLAIRDDVVMGFKEILFQSIRKAGIEFSSVREEHISTIMTKQSGTINSVAQKINENSQAILTRKMKTCNERINAIDHHVEHLTKYKNTLKNIPSNQLVTQFDAIKRGALALLHLSHVNPILHHMPKEFNTKSIHDSLGTDAIKALADSKKDRASLYDNANQPLNKTQKSNPSLPSENKERDSKSELDKLEQRKESKRNRLKK